MSEIVSLFLIRSNREHTVVRNVAVMSSVRLFSSV